MKPKGKIVIIGGAEDKGDDGSTRKEKIYEWYEEFEILKELLPIQRSSNKKIEIITTASKVQDEIKTVYKKAFHKLGYSNIGFMAINDKIEAKEKKNIDRVQKASTILFSGGDQFRLSTILGGTKLMDIIKEKYFTDGNFIVAGTSAGAMAISKTMITEGGVSEVLVDTDIKTSAGLGFLEYCIVDTHFIKRGRFSRLAHAIIINPGQLGIGLGEDAALVIRNGEDAECYGSGMIVLIDGKYIE
ncbi:MAG: cyanophycinase, partial [Bacteroidetes bacterium]|nr:cyanophycinase [Bacteroidota bacterium]